MSNSKIVGRTVWLELLCLLALFIFVQRFAFTLEYSPLVDEVFHLLAARSWSTDGTFAIADGEYGRAAGYTAALGMLFSIFGEDLVLARVVSILAGAIWVAALFAWVRDAAGRLAAWTAALLFAFAPTSVFVFHFVRFYSAQGLFFFLGAIGLYILVTGRVALTSAAGALVAVGVALALAVAMHLQIVTITGLIALSVWVALELCRRFLAEVPQRPGVKWWLGGGFLLAALAGVALIQSRLGGSLLEMYRDAALWNVGNKYNVLYYHNMFFEQYPVLWALLPVAALFALARRTQPALFCICIFGIVVILHSFAGMKMPRYIHFAVPFFFALWGIVLAEAIPLARGLAATAMERLLPENAWPPLRRIAGGVCLGIAVLFLAVGTPGLKETYWMAQRWPEFPSHPDAVWAKARPFLQPWLDKADVVLTTNDVHAIYYFGRYNYQISRYRVTETESGQEFGRDARTGRPVISTLDSVRLVVSCHPSGLFLGDPFQWRHEIMGVSDPVANLLEANAERIEVPVEWDLRAYYWQRADAAVAPECDDLPSYSRPADDKPIVAVEPQK